METIISTQLDLSSSLLTLQNQHAIIVELMIAVFFFFKKKKKKKSSLVRLQFFPRSIWVKFFFFKVSLYSRNCHFDEVYKIFEKPQFNFELFQKTFLLNFQLFATKNQHFKDSPTSWHSFCPLSIKITSTSKISNVSKVFPN